MPNHHDFSDDEREGLNIALNEATLLGAEIDETSRVATITLSVLTLPEVGGEPEDPRLQIVLLNVGRAAASLRLGRWDDETAPAVPFAPKDLLVEVRRFGGCAIYGWEFFDVADRDVAKWNGRFSFDVSYSASDGRRHSLRLFQDEDRYLDFLIWFDALRLRNAAGEDLEMSDVIAGGRRWWKALRENDPRVAGHGIVPLAAPDAKDLTS